MTALIVIAVWLVFGYAFSYWFGHHFLENGHWGDGRKFDAIDAVMVHLASPVMAFVIFVGMLFIWLADRDGLSNLARKFYRIK